MKPELDQISVKVCRTVAKKGNVESNTNTKTLYLYIVCKTNPYLFILCGERRTKIYWYFLLAQMTHRSMNRQRARWIVGCYLTSCFGWSTTPLTPCAPLLRNPTQAFTAQNLTMFSIDQDKCSALPLQTVTKTYKAKAYGGFWHELRFTCVTLNGRGNQTM